VCAACAASEKACTLPDTHRLRHPGQGPILPTNVQAVSQAVSYVNTHRPRFQVRARPSYPSEWCWDRLLFARLSSRRPLPVSPRPPSGIDTSRCWARQCRCTGETPVFCTSVCVCDPRDAAVTCPARRGCHSCDVEPDEPNPENYTSSDQPKKPT